MIITSFPESWPPSASGDFAMSDVIKSYLAEIDREFKTGKATEHTHRPALKKLIEALDGGIRATNEPKRVECGAPDFVLRRDSFTVGYVETKDLGKSLDEAEDSDQLDRYKRSLPNLILTDYLEFRWFVDGAERQHARLGRIGKGDRIQPDKKGIDETLELLQLFLESRPQPVTTPKDLSERAARLAHRIADIIRAVPILRPRRIGGDYTQCLYSIQSYKARGSIPCLFDQTTSSRPFSPPGCSH